MAAQEQIAKLESLLERIRRNAQKPRPARAEAVRAQAPARPEPPVAAARVAPQELEPSEEPTLTEVSLESLGATEARAPSPKAPEAKAPAAKAPPPAEPVRERVQSADMDDLEIVEIGSDVTELATIDEPVPESAPRPAVQSVEVELEPPIKTPPPESGRQAVTPPPAMAEPKSSDDDFDDDDLADVSGAPISITTAPVEELELAAPETARVELEPHSQVPAEPREVSSRRVDPLAATVPDMRTALSLAQTVPDARSPFADAIRATTEAKAETPAAPDVSKPVEKPPAPAPSVPELVVERPPSTALHAAEVVVATPRRVPETFLELLDASLELRA